MEEVRNMQVLARDYISGIPKESDMYLSSSASIKFKVPQDSNAVLVKNLYLSCDPYTRGTKNPEPGRPAFFAPNSPIVGLGVGKVLDSGHPEFKEGDLVWGMTKWEEYTLITNTRPHQNPPY
ncbi:hypothetical protein TIFTF001_005770 [Ficus carica]|uniref:Oxidoreductase N-terminal domain-containing protein n=1 Tax=Ficus carica TaxID=3494 RepID=A0AA87ZLH4_FICCA|nr:hypothetical protein TIFTF001_005770 [Ficus carica]